MAAEEAYSYSTWLRPWKPGLVMPSRPPAVETASAEKNRIRKGWMMMHSAVSFISRPSIFLPRYSGVRPIIRPQMNTARMAYMIMFIRPTPLPPKTTFSIMCSKRDHAAQRRQGIVHVVDGAGGERGRGGGEHGRLGDAEPDLLALHAAHGLVQADLCQSRVALELRPVAHAQADQEDDTHGQEDRAALPAVDGRRQAVVLQAGALLSSARRQLAGGFAAGQRLVAGGILLSCGRAPSCRR